MVGPVVGSLPQLRRVLGFTLVELMVVMAIVALLAAIALPRYFGSIDRARETALTDNLRTMRVAIDRFRADKGRYPENLEELVTQRYLHAIPVDPVTESSGTWVATPAEGLDARGVGDVRSGAAGEAPSGRAYASL